MKVFIPKTNPIVLHDNSYKEWQDALKFESKHCFVQKYITTDRLTFQVVMNKSGYINSRIKVYIENESGVQTNINSIDFNADGGGVYPTAYVRRIGTTFVFVFSDLFSNFASAYVGKSFRIVVGITDNIGVTDEKQFKSNLLCLSATADGTKKIHYNHIVSLQESVYGTYFNLVPYGYDLRLDCYFLQVQEKSNDEIFQAYDGSFELVSSIPYQTFELQLTENGFGLPDWFIENLAYIFKCYYKFIDEVQYQVAENGELTIDKADRYNNRFAKIELCRKQERTYDVDSTPSTNVYIDYDADNRNGKITIDLPAGNYAIVADNYVFSDNTFDGSTSLDFYVGKNLTENDITTDAEIIDLASGEVVGSLQLVNAVYNRGLCAMEVCDTLTIMPKKEGYELPAIGTYVPPPPTPASITILSVVGIGYDGATINVSIMHGGNVSKTGIEVDTDPTFSNPTIFEENGAVSSVVVDGLNDNTLYYVRAYVIDNGVQTYSTNSSNFTTLEIAPTITLVDITNITDASADANVLLTGSNITKTGVEIDTDPLFSNPTQYEENGAVNTIAVDNLDAETTYYVRGYVVWSGQTIYSSNSLNFTTASGSILPAELQGCEWLESTGMQYIDTGINATNNLKIFLEFSFPNAFEVNQNGAIKYAISIYSRHHLQTNSNKIQYGYGAGSSGNIYDLDTYNNDTHTLQVSKDGIIYDSINIPINNVSFNCNANYYLFARKGNGLANSFAKIRINTAILENSGVECKLYSCYVKSGQTFTDNKGNVCSAGTCGMYDTINGVFYTNDGTGTFSHGADINI